MSYSELKTEETKIPPPQFIEAVFGALKIKQRTLIAKSVSCPIWFYPVLNGKNDFRAIARNMLDEMVRKKQKQKRDKYNNNVDQINDDGFKDYNANRIGPQTNYYAFEGPPLQGGHSGICRFFANTAFRGINKVTALGKLGKDFLNYLQDDVYDFNDVKYQVKAERIRQFSYESQERINQNVHEITINYTTTALTIVRSCADKPPVTKQLLVKNIDIPDVWPVILPNKREILGWYYELYNDSATESIAKHCTAGMGRTGHVILTFLILDYFEAIFNPLEGCAEQSAANIQKLVAYIRSFRSAAITTQDQIQYAIQNAVKLYEYELSLPMEQRKDRSQLVSFNQLIADTDNTVAVWMGITPLQHEVFLRDIKEINQILSLEKFSILQKDCMAYVILLCTELKREFISLKYQDANKSHQIYSMGRITKELMQDLAKYRQDDSESILSLEKSLGSFKNTQQSYLCDPQEKSVCCCFFKKGKKTENPVYKAIQFIVEKCEKILEFKPSKSVLIKPSSLMSMSVS